MTCPITSFLRFFIPALITSNFFPSTLSTANVNDFSTHFLDLDFIIAGFPQSGSCSLVHYLLAHNEIYMSPALEDNALWRANYSSSSVLRQWRKKYPYRGDTVLVDKTSRGSVNEFGERFESYYGIRARSNTTTTLPEIESESLSESDVLSDDSEAIAFLQSEDSNDSISNSIHHKQPSYIESPPSRSHDSESVAITAFKHRSINSETQRTKKHKHISLLGLKDPLLILSPQVMHSLGHRVLTSTKILVLLREPLEMIISWLMSGASWRTPWDDRIGWGIGLYGEHLMVGSGMAVQGSNHAKDVSTGMNEKSSFLYIPSHQLDVNTGKTMGKVLEFIGVNRNDSSMDGVAYRDRLHVGRYQARKSSKKNITPSFFFPNELDACLLETLPFLASIYEGQRKVLTRIIDEQGVKGENNDIKFDKPYFYGGESSSEAPKQCRVPRWTMRKNWVEGLKSRGKARGIGISSVVVRKKTNPGGLDTRKRKLKPKKYKLIQPQSFLPYACDLAPYSGKSQISDPNLAGSGNFLDCINVIPFRYHSDSETSDPNTAYMIDSRKHRPPDACTSALEMTPFFDSRLQKAFNCKLELNKEANSDSDSEFDKDLDACSLCCVQFSPKCWNQPDNKKLPNCCIRKLSSLLGPTGFFVTQEICGNAIGCCGVNFETPANEFGGGV